MLRCRQKCLPCHSAHPLTAACCCLVPLPLVVQERRDGRAPLSRESLIADIEKKGLLSLVPPAVKQVFGLLESDFNPLQLCKVVAPLLDSLPTLNQPVSGASELGSDGSRGVRCV